MSRVSYPPALDVSDGPAYDPSDKPFVPAASGPITLLQSLFTVGTDTNLASYTPDVDLIGSGYTITGGVWTCRNPQNYLEMPAAAYPGTLYATIDPASHGTYTNLITALKVDSASDLLQLNVRWADTSNRFGVNRQVNQIDLFEITGGSAFVRSTTSLGAPDPTKYVHISDDETTIRAGEGGTDLVSYVSSTNNSVKVTGLGCYATSYNVDDHVVVVNSIDPADLP